MPTLFPPFVSDQPKYKHDDSFIEKRLMSFYRNGPRGVSVWILKDDHVTPQWPKVSFIEPPSQDWWLSYYIGGHYYPVDDAEAALLGGLGLYVIPDPLPEEVSWDAVLAHYASWAEFSAINPTWQAVLNHD